MSIWDWFFPAPAADEQKLYDSQERLALKIDALIKERDAALAIVRDLAEAWLHQPQNSACRFCRAKVCTVTCMGKRAATSLVESLLRRKEDGHVDE